MKLARILSLLLTICIMLGVAQFPVLAEDLVFEASASLEEISVESKYTYSSSERSINPEEYMTYQVSLPTSPNLKLSEYYAKSLGSFQQNVYRAFIDGYTINANNLNLKQSVAITYQRNYSINITTQQQLQNYVENKLEQEMNNFDLDSFYDAVQYDHTELFWMQGIVIGIAADARAENGRVTMDYTLAFFCDASELFVSNSALRTAAKNMNTAVNNIIANVPTTSQYDVLVYFNDWLKQNNTYNHPHLEQYSYPLAHGAYSAFTSNGDEATGPVCQGYAYALKYLCDKMGYNNVVVMGDLYQTGAAPGPHAWNAVEIDGNWYAIDTTANDSLDTDEYYFLVGSNTPSHDPGYPTFSSSHVIDDTHVYPTLSTTAYESSVVCTHSYDNDCDADCNDCGAKRTVQHVYDNTCDKNCNRCGEIRVIVHTYDDDTDTVCNVCGEQREPSTPASSFEYEINNNKVTIKQYIGTETDVVIPKTIEGYPVTELGSSAFYQNSSVKSVILPDGLELIGSFAFFRCYGITEMKIPDSVKTINVQAFNDCKSLKTIDLGEGIQVIKDRAFYGCEALESITFPSSLTTLAYNVFSGCKALTEITIPATITSLDTDMFTHCTGLKSVVIEEGVTTIPEYTFYNCNQLTTVTLPASVATVERAAFHSCTSITTVHFAGSKADRDSMSIGQWNDAFINATWRYDGAGNDDDDDVVEGCSHTYDNGCDIICNECGETRTKLVGTKVTGLKASNVSLSYPYQRYGNDLSTMFDGDTTAVDGNGMQLNWSASTDAKTIVISLDEPTDLAGLNIFWGNNDWNAVPAQTYKIYLAREGEVTSDSPAVYSFSNDLTNQDGVLRDDFITFSEVEENVVEIHIKVSAHYKKGDLAIRELEILEATYVPVQEPEHKYSNKCDADCNVCGAIREVPDHVYDNDCDTDCNECGAIREVPDHVYDNDCDTDCDECGATRTVPDHIYDNAYDPDCNECGEERVFREFNVGETVAFGLQVDTANGIVVEDPTKTLTIGTPVILPDYVAFNVTVPAGASGKYVQIVVKDNDGKILYKETIKIAGTPRLSGDVNEDGAINGKDFAILRQFLNDWEVEINESNADVNADGNVNGKDMALLRQYLNDWDVVLK